MGKLVGIALLIFSLAFFIEALNNTPGIMDNIVENFNIDTEYIADIKELWEETK